MGDARGRDLIDAYLDGDADESQVRALEAWLAADPARADQFVFETFLHAQIRDEACRPNLSAGPGGDSSGRLAEVAGRPRVARAAGSATGLRRWWVGAAATGIAAAAAVALLLTARPWHRPGSSAEGVSAAGRAESGRVIATATATAPAKPATIAAATMPAGTLAHGSRSARVFSGGTPVAAGQAVAAGGPAEVRAGVAQFDLPGGVQVILEAPAAFELVAGGLRLDAGKLLARVPGGQTFTVGTAAARLVNRGTEAGVEVTGGAGGGTTVEVFSGVVDAFPAGDPGRPPAAAIAQVAAGDAKQIFTPQPDADADAPPAVCDVAPAARPEWVRRFFGRDGVVSIGGPAEMRLLDTPPASVEQDALEDEDRLVVFRERAEYVLPHDVTAHLNVAGQTSWAGTTPVVIPAGTVVDSYLVHFGSPLPADDSPGWRGSSIRFERPVLGVLWAPAELAASAAALGAPPTRYPGADRAGGAAVTAGGKPQRFRVGPEATPERPEPRFNSDNLCWFSVHFPHRGGFAQYRVLVRSAGG